MAEEPKVQDVTEKGSKGPTILILVNSLGILLALGALVYTQFYFKRPNITESSERSRIENVYKKPNLIQRGQVIFQTMTVNIQSIPNNPNYQSDTASKMAGKIHYATLGFVIEIKDASKISQIESVRPIFTDKLISVLGRKEFHELNTVQGRYLLRTEIIELVNQLVKEPLASNVFFTQFIVQ